MEAEQFSRAIEPCLDKLYRAAFRLTQNRADAEELFQETCVRAFARRASSWETTTSPLGWLMRVQYNLFIDETRKRRASVVVPIGDAEHSRLIAGEDFDPEACASEAQQFALIQHAWSQLKKDQRALIALRVEGYTLPEMQDITGLSVDALNSRLQRARQSLARLMTTDRGAAKAPKRMETKR
jgi:RNA polymerase sigma-70 factor (ECF subfamily)